MTKSWRNAFDSVVMLTWSDWKTEPRSNRYHFATRFGRHVPVYFVQPDSPTGSILFEEVAAGITIVHAPMSYSVAAADSLMTSLNSAGVRRPLLWIYNVLFESFIVRYGARLKILHATEDYFSDAEGWAVADPQIRVPLTRALGQIDLLVAVSDGVLDSYVQQGKFTGRSVVLRNGCDFEFWEQSQATRYEPPGGQLNVALYQGGINSRLDFKLLGDLAKKMPDWQFWYCGHTRNGGAGWAQLRHSANVRYFGEQSVEGIALLSRQSAVGLIPFQQDELIRRSLPLKAFEYVACGLPVVTVPIDALKEWPNLFVVAKTLDEFASAIREAGQHRTDPLYLAACRSVASKMSYTESFGTLERELDNLLSTEPGTWFQRLNVLLIYDDLNSTHVSTIREHIAAFLKYSRHAVVVMPGTGHFPNISDREAVPDLNPYDAVVIHYSVRLSVKEHLANNIAKAIQKYSGPKIAFLQDEYENTNTARDWIDDLGITCVYTVVPEQHIDHVYPKSRFRNVDFVTTLTGYVPEAPELTDLVRPISEREHLIGYRGRRLPHHYGELGQDKYRIGVEVKKAALQRGLSVDIEVEDIHRIYGRDWYRFLASSRATLGTESGANVFDDDGSLKEIAAKYQHLPFDQFEAKFLGGRDGIIRMNQISPKIFEAAKLNTALILFDGEYSGVVRPNEHFIPLKKDFSNIDEVFDKVQDVKYVEELTRRTYLDLIESKKYSYSKFLEGFDKYLDMACGSRARAVILSAPIVALYGGFDPVALWPWGSLAGLANGVVLDASLDRYKVLALTGAVASPELTLPHEPSRLVNSADRGAFIVSSTASCPRPNDLDYLLRHSTAGGYAASIDGQRFPLYIEIDLGHSIAVNEAHLEWFDRENYGTHFTIEVRHQADKPWIMIVDAQGNGMVSPRYAFPSQWARIVRFTLHACEGQQRLLMRAFSLLATEAGEFSKVAPATLGSDPNAADGFMKEAAQITSLPFVAAADPSRNVAVAMRGAAIIASSPCFTYPHDAGCLVRDTGPEDYAAMLDGSPLPHFIELDFGRSVMIEEIQIRWYDEGNFAADYEVQIRRAIPGAWSRIVAVTDNASPLSTHQFRAVRAKRLRLSTSRVVGQQRMLIRYLKVLEPVKSG